MMDRIQGSAIVVGANIDTDQIYPGRYLELVEPEDIARHAMEGVDPDFQKRFQEGDIIVADRNFGCGSSREHAVIALKTLGVSAVIAPSFGRIFYRNAINLGLPLITCSEILEGAAEGDRLEVLLSQGRILNQTQEVEIRGEALPEFVLEMIAHGGIKKYHIAMHEGKA